MPSSAGIEQIKKDEGISRRAEKISVKGKKEANLTIGHGFNLSRSDAKESLLLAGVSPLDVDEIMRGEKDITDEQIENLFDISLNTANRDVEDLLPEVESAPQAVKDVLSNMSFQLGKKRLSGFEDMLSAAKEGNWPKMKEEMLKSEWAKQTPSRAKRLANKIGGVKFTPEPTPAKTAIGQRQSGRTMFEQNQFDARADEIASFLSRDQLIDEIAGLIPDKEEISK